MVPTFKALQPSYAKLWAALVPSPEHLPALKKICAALIAHKSTYQAVSQAVWGDPQYWWYVAVTDQMEGGGGANTYLGNGQSLARPTTEVPAGRGPFKSFLAGAIDALQTVEKVAAPTSVEQAAFDWEGFNGWGYLNKPINDPYLASQSNQYTKGKYVSDHVYDPEAVSEQPGALTILKVLITLDPTIQLEGATTVTTTPTPTAPALATIMMELDKITKVLETVVTYVPMVAPFFPPMAPIIPFLPVIQAGLALLDQIESAGGDPVAMVKAVESAIPNLMSTFKAAQAHPTVIAATAAVQAGPPQT